MLLLSLLLFDVVIVVTVIVIITVAIVAAIVTTLALSRSAAQDAAWLRRAACVIGCLGPRQPPVVPYMLVALSLSHLPLLRD